MAVNPILTGFHPDPSIVRVGEDFFLATSTFEYTPSVPIYHSRNLRQWTLIGHALSRPSQLHVAGGVEPGGGVWAPTLRHHDGVFYLATSSFEQFYPQEGKRLFPRGFYVKTDNIWDSSSWSDPVFFDSTGFDQDLFWDDDGRVYLSTTHSKIDRPADAPRSRLEFAIHISEVDLATGDALSPTVMLRESPSGIAEGSHLYRRGRYYYLLVAEGGTGAKHSECVYRSEQGVRGPWEPAPGNPILRSQGDDVVQKTGHVDLVEDAGGEWWAVLLGVRPLRTNNGTWKESVFGRETFVAPVKWVDEWPVINDGQKICLGLKRGASDDQVWRDDFSAPTLQLGWYRKNTPQKVDYTIMTSPPRLRLHGGPHNLSTPGCPNLFLQKQRHCAGMWKTKLSFRPTEEYEEAGTVVWWNYLTYSSIGIRRASSAAGGRLVRLRPAEGCIVEWPLQRADSDVLLLIRCSEEGYGLGFRELGGAAGDGAEAETRWLGSVSSEVMTQDPSIGLAFSGMLLGVYAFAEYRRLTAPADFHHVEFRPGS